MQIRQFIVDGLGHLSALVADEGRGVAAVVDPRRDVDVYLDAAREAGVRISHVVETHLHNDYVSGGRQLAALTGASQVIGAGAELSYEHRPVRDREGFHVGRLRFTALDTPGHTPEHVVYALADTSRADEPVVLFTGGSLLVGAVGRTDLLGAENAVPYARAMHRSLHDVILSHEDFVDVYPTHGAGSLCSTGIASTPQTTIGFERRYNPLLQPMDVDAFATALLTGQPAFPRYFGRMRPTNQAGPRLVGARPPLPPPIAVDAARGMLRGDAVLVDLRPGRAHADGHPPGSVSIPAGSSFGTWLGWVVEPDRPLVLLVDSTTDVDDAIRQAYRVGYETVIGLVDGGWPAWLAAGGPVETTRELTTGDLAGRLASDGGRQVVLDVRQRTEYESAHIPGSWHLLAGWLPDRLAALPRDRPIATICASGFRSSIAASLLRRAGFSDVAWVSDGVPDWEAAGHPIERGEPAGQDQSPAPTRP